MGAAILADAMPASSPKIDSLEKLLGTPRDGALLRYGLGVAHAEAGNAAEAIAHLSRAVGFDAGYSAAWSALGRALADSGRRDEAIAAWSRGIEAARAKGDKQAEKTMAVFVKRLQARG